MNIQAEFDFEEEKMPSNMDVFLIPEQKYSISLDLIVPRDKTNLQVGLFMTCLTLKNGNYSQVMSKICKSAILPHRTSIYVLKWSLFPFQVSMPHSLKIPEILSQAFLTKIS